MKKSFNIRQQKYKKNRIVGMNMYNAARAAGYSHHYATKATATLEKSITSLQDELEQQGITNKKIVEILSEAILANKVVGYLHQYKKGEKGRVEEIKPDEVISNEFLEVPDWHIRHKFMELALKIKGELKEKAIEVHTHYTTVIKQIHSLSNSNGEKKEGDNGRTNAERSNRLIN